MDWPFWQVFKWVFGIILLGGLLYALYAYHCDLTFERSVMTELHNGVSKLVNDTELEDSKVLKQIGEFLTRIENYRESHYGNPLKKGE